MVKACNWCGKPLERAERPGRPADYCSSSCAKRMEQRRAQWDQRAALCDDPGGYYAENRDWDRTPEQRAYWQAELDRARMELGDRP